MKFKYILATLLTLCLLISIAACDQADDPPTNDTTAEIITEAPTESITETPTEAPAHETYPITVRVEGKGTVTFNGEDVAETLTKELIIAESISLTAAPAEGFFLKGWFEETDGERKLLHDEGSVTFTVPAREATLVAVFEKAYLLDIFTPEPEMGFFTVDGREESYTNWGASAAGPYTYSVTVDGNDRVILPRFTVAEDVLFTIRVMDDMGASFLLGNKEIPGDGWEKDVPYGSTMTVTVILEEGYTFEGWYIEYYDEEYQIYYAFYSDELTITYTCLEEYCTLVVFVKGGPIVEGDIPPVVN